MKNLKSNRTMLLAFAGLFAAFVLVLTGFSAFADSSRIAIGNDDEASHTADAKITSEQAKATAEDHTNGTALSVQLENEDGYLVYGVLVQTSNGKLDVKVDAGNGSVLKAEADDGSESHGSED